MQDRIKAIIDYKTGGRIGAFGALIGWSPQYLSKLLRGECIGLTPVRAILEALPEINARWLILGEGRMLEDAHVATLRSEAMAHARSLIELDRYVGVMTPDDLAHLENALASGRTPIFNDADIARWEALLSSSNRHAASERALDASKKAR